MTTIGEKVRALRTARRLSQGDLAKRLGISQSAVSQIEKGVTRSLSGYVLAGLCEHLHIVPQLLIGGDVDLSTDNGLLEAEALYLFRRMDRDRQHAAVEMLRGLSGAIQPSALPPPRIIRARNVDATEPPVAR